MRGRKKEIIIVRPDGSKQQYASQSEASRREQIKQTTISQMCRLNITVNGYTASFASEPV